MKNLEKAIVAQRVARRLTDAGFDAFVVGGAVRDHVIGRECKDVDLATNATPDEVMALFGSPPRTLKPIPTGIKHGTISIISSWSTCLGDPRDQMVEVTTFRKDVDTDGRRATVEWADTVGDDLGRRDFTMNGLAYDFETGEIHDPFEGMKDIDDKLIRVISAPDEDPGQRFREDGLRILRAVRFKAQLGFKIEEETFVAMRKNHTTLHKVSFERRRDELLKILASPPEGVEAGLNTLRQLGMLTYVLPGMMASVGCKQNVFHKDDVWTHSVLAAKAMRELTDDPEMVLAALLHDIGKPATKKVTYNCQECGKRDPKNVLMCVRCNGPTRGDVSFHGHDIVGAKMAAKELKKLKFSNKSRDRITTLIRYHLFWLEARTEEYECCGRTWRVHSSKHVNTVKGSPRCSRCKKIPTPKLISEESSLSSIRRLARNVGGEERFEDLLLLRQADRAGNRKKRGTTWHFELVKEMYKAAVREDQAFKIRDLEINGHDLMTIGVPPGPRIGEVLRDLSERVLDEPSLNTKQELTRIVEEQHAIG